MIIHANSYVFMQGFLNEELRLESLNCPFLDAECQLNGKYGTLQEAIAAVARFITESIPCPADIVARGHERSARGNTQHDADGIW